MNSKTGLQVAGLFGGTMLLLLVTGCPPPEGHVPEILVKSLYSMGCQGCAPQAGDEKTILLPGNVSLVLVWIPGGDFMMGRYEGEQSSSFTEDPQHAVSVPGFWMGKYEVTKRQWQALMGTTPWTGEDYVVEYPDSPAIYVSWNDALAFTAALRTYAGETVRLPSEAEWEYACRAGTTTRFYWGDDPTGSAGNSYAWWARNALEGDEPYAHVTGMKLPNAWGLYDMIGNVSEFCEDDYHGGYADAPNDGSAWVNNPRGSHRVVRGGSWSSDTLYCRSAFRNQQTPVMKVASMGFRIAK